MWSSIAEIPDWVLFCLVVWLLGCTWVGYKRGVVRQALAIAALALGWFGAFSLGPMLSPLVPALGFPVFARPIVSGVITGLAVWIVTMLLGAILFKKTSEQSFGIIRIIYGVSGAALGLVFGVSVLVMVAWGVRIFGSFHEGVQKATTRVGRRYGPEPDPSLSLKRIMDESSLSSFIQKIDPLKSDLYPRLEKAGQLLASPTALDRFLNAPEAFAFARHPKIQALRDDPQFLENLKNGDVLALLQNPRLQAAASDAQLMTAFNALNLEKLVDRSISKVEPPPLKEPTPALPAPPPSSGKRPKEKPASTR